MHRVNISFTDEDWRKMSRLCKKLRPYQPVGTTLREILLHRFTGCKALEHGVKSCADGLGHTQDQDQAPRGSSSQKEESKNTEKKEKRSPRLAPMDVSERIIGHLAAVTGVAMRPNAEGHRLHIQRRLDKGATVEQMIRVIDRQHRAWKGTKYYRHMVPETLFGGKFDKYYDAPEASDGRPRQTTLGGNTFAPADFAVGADDLGESDKPPHLMFAHAEEGERKE